MNDRPRNTGVANCLRLVGAACMIAACLGVYACDPSYRLGPFPHDDPDEDWASTPAPTYHAHPGPPASCPIGSAEWGWFHDAAGTADASIHELIACGGAQVALARTLFLAVFAGNEAIFQYDPATLQEVAAQLGGFASAGQLPFDELGSGLWRMKNTAGTSAGVAFDVRLHDVAGEPVLANPFLLESYLQGVKVSYSMTFVQMKAAPQTPNTFVISWEKLGKLGVILGGARGEVPNPIVLKISAMEFLAAADGSGSAALFGPFANLLDLGLSSRVELVQNRLEGQVRYDMQAPRQALRVAALSSVVDFQVVGLAVTGQGRALRSDGAGKLSYGAYGLVGSLTLTGQRQDGGDVQAQLSYDNSKYATTSWQCP